MTLPEQIQLPLPKKQSETDENAINEEYIEELINDLEKMYEDIVFDTNGNIVEFLPVLNEA